MLALPKKTDYALIALHYLLEHPGRVAPAREIAETHHLPCALLMNVMKELQQGGLVRSVRGARGGYQLNADPREVTLYDVVVLTSGEPHLTECCGGLGESSSDGVHVELGTPAGMLTANAEPYRCSVGQHCPVRAPLRGLHGKLMVFLKEVKLADLLQTSTRAEVMSGGSTSDMATR
jgi:Rrf2 family protein